MKILNLTNRSLTHTDHEEIQLSSDDSKTLTELYYKAQHNQGLFEKDYFGSNSELFLNSIQTIEKIVDSYRVQELEQVISGISSIISDRFLKGDLTMIDMRSINDLHTFSVLIGSGYLVLDISLVITLVKKGIQCYTFCNDESPAIRRTY